jgi:uncharacterized protein YndB with AHSA1/START domain
MKLIHSIFVDRPPRTVWAFLENPANMLLWNPKVKRVSPSTFSAGPELGYRYAITYQMHERARAQEFLAEFIRFEPFSKLVIRHTGGLSPHNRIIEESYELAERSGGSFLTQSIHIENSGINIFLRILIWIIQRWGKPTGKPYLGTLRDIIERDTEKESGH